MNTSTLRLTLASLALTSAALTSCKKDSDDIAPVLGTTTPEKVTSLAPQPANPTVLTPTAVNSLAPQAAAPTGTGAPGTPRHHTFYSFATGAEVPYTDSASTKWDLAFRGTTVLINGGTSGPGQGGAIVATGTSYDAQTTAPTTGYAVDGATAKAIPTGTGNGWYNYSSTTYVVSPIADRVLLIRTALGKYAKLQIQNYYRNAPATPNAFTDLSGYYTFRYSYQADGSTALTTTTATSTGQPATPKHYTFYSLVTKSTVPYTDSATTKWDLAFRGTTVLINGGTSGPGQGGAQIKTTLFEELIAAPTTGYAVDGATAKAIPTGSGNGWYSYDQNTHVISSIAGRVIALKTALGKYAKVEIQNYYKDAPAAPGATDPSGYYTFRYLYQADGSTNLK
jgi:hypothetical protein